MARAIRKTRVEIGIVGVDVGLYKMEETTKTRLSRLCSCGAHPTNNITCSNCGEEYGRSWRSLPNQGLKVGKDSYLVIPAEEIEEAKAQIEKRDVFTLEKVVDYKSLSSRYVVVPSYYVMPPKDASTATLKAFTLLVQSLDKKGRAALSRLTIRQNKRLALIADADRNVLVAAIVLNARDVPHEIERPDVSEAEVKLMDKLLETSFSEDVTFEPEADPVEELLEAKADGATVTTLTPASKPKKETNLVEQLEASLKQASE